MSNYNLSKISLKNKNYLFKQKNNTITETPDEQSNKYENDQSTES